MTLEHMSAEELKHYVDSVADADHNVRQAMVTFVRFLEPVLRDLEQHHLADRLAAHLGEHDAVQIRIHELFCKVSHRQVAMMLDEIPGRTVQ